MLQKQPPAKTAVSRDAAVSAALFIPDALAVELIPKAAGTERIVVVNNVNLAFI